MMAFDVVLLGAPGAGKGTHSERLREWLPLPQVSSGDLFRDAIVQGSELGRLADGYISRGELVPDEVTIAMVAERLAEPDCAEGAILDGFPRTLVQARALDALLAERGRRVDVVINLRVDEETLLERLSGRWTCSRCGRTHHRIHEPERVLGICDSCGGKLVQRKDDRPETQQRRIAVYTEQTAPLIRYYRKKGVLVDIDGGHEIDVVAAQIREAIEPLLRGAV